MYNPPLTPIPPISKLGANALQHSLSLCFSLLRPPNLQAWSGGGVERGRKSQRLESSRGGTRGDERGQHTKLFDLLPFYAILRSIPNKLLGVVAMFGAILVLLALPLLDPAKVRGMSFKPVMKLTF